ncbi:MAG: 50S ribosomal protein L29 [Candidatus Micrarchaeota archaeon]|nr:50S ribosomal protein L29 [Candidatus Micrarchaeota archaeon]
MKAKELREKSNEELISLEKDLRSLLLKTERMKRRAIRREIARVLTVLGERGIKLG